MEKKMNKKKKKRGLTGQVVFGGVFFPSKDNPPNPDQSNNHLQPSTILFSFRAGSEVWMWEKPSNIAEFSNPCVLIIITNSPKTKKQKHIPRGPCAAHDAWWLQQKDGSGARGLLFFNLKFFFFHLLFISSRS